MPRPRCSNGSSTAVCHGTVLLCMHEIYGLSAMSTCLLLRERSNSGRDGRTSSICIRSCPAMQHMLRDALDRCLNRSTRSPRCVVHT